MRNKRCLKNLESFVEENLKDDRFKMYYLEVLYLEENKEDSKSKNKKQQDLVLWATNN